MSSDTPAQVRGQYDECIAKINNLTAMVKQLSGEYELEGLEEVVVEEDYFNLLANSLYAVNSLVFAYSNTKGVPFPNEFVKVKEYYNKAKNPMVEPEKPAASQTAPIVVNKQAVKRVIQRSIK